MLELHLASIIVCSLVVKDLTCKEKQKTVLFVLLCGIKRENAVIFTNEDLLKNAEV